MVYEHRLTSQDADVAEQALTSVYGAGFRFSVASEEEFSFGQFATGDGPMAVAGLQFSGACHAVADGFPVLIVSQAVRGSHAWRLGSEQGVGTVPWVLPHDRVVEVEFRNMVNFTLNLDPAAVLDTARSITGVESARFDLDGANRPRADPVYMEAMLRRYGANPELTRLMFASPLLAAAEFRAVVAALIETFPILAYQAVPVAEGEHALPAALRRAMVYLDENAHLPITVDDVAAAARLSTRALEYQFQHRLETTPMAYLRRVRLAGAHQDLVASDPAHGASVRDIALRWGFGHLGRFAKHYRDAYGELPHATLER